MQTTSDIIKAFVSISAQSHSGPSSEEMLKRCQEAETEVRHRSAATDASILTCHSVPLFDRSLLLYARDCTIRSRRGKITMNSSWPPRNGRTDCRASR